MKNEEELREEAKRNILRNRRALKEFANYPASWLNKLIGLRYKFSDPIEKQIRDYVKFEQNNNLRKLKKFDIIVIQ